VLSGEVKMLENIFFTICFLQASKILVFLS